MAEGPASSPLPKEPNPKPSDELIGRTINDRFRITGVVARGGMGKVYRAEQAPLGREVALKILNPNYSGDSDPEFHKRFFLEASTCSKLSHPNTVTIFDYGRTDDDIYYIAMELLEGRTLHRALREDGPLPPERAMHVARQICRSLREAHKLGIVHRDLKPANIFLVKHGDETDFVKVLDFGLVKELEGAGEDLTQTGLFMGSPKYMSPEQIKGEGVDSRADVYALGVIMYEMLTGTVPFDRPNSVNILMAHVHDPPPPLRETNPDVDVPHALSDVVMKALAKDAALRYASMDDVLTDLKQLANDAGLAITRSTELGLSGLNTGPYSSVQPTYDSAPPPSSSSALLSYPGVPSSGATALSSAPSGSFGAPPSGVTITGSGPHVPEPSSMAYTEAPSRAPLVMALFGALALVAALAVALVLNSRRETPTPTPSRPVVERPVVTPEVPVPPPPATTTMVQLRSDPPGAQVTVGGRTHGPTPTDIEWAGADAERGRRVTFVFSLDGHQDYTVTRVVTGEVLEVDATLEPSRPSRPAARRGPRSGGRREGRSGPINGYKLDPY